MEWLTDNVEHPFICAMFFLAGLFLGHIAPLELPPASKQPIIIYKADNKGAEIKGKVVHKEKIGDMYTITVKNYGIFVVTQTSYESLRIGDEVRL